MRLPPIPCFSYLLIFFLSVSISSHARARLEGVITDFSTGKPIVGVSVSIKGFSQGTITDEKGYFSIILPFGEHEVIFSAVGYRTRSKFVHLTRDVRLTIQLQEEAKQLEEVIITGKTADHNVKDAQMGTVQLDMLNIRKIPVVLGETDIIRALTLQPGVSTIGEGAGGFNVRGGRVDQNLVLLDGAPLFNTSHLLGFFTSINPDVIQDVTLYKGSFPAQYGGRLASLLTMNTKTGSEEHVRLSGGISPISGRLLVQGPIVKNKITFLAGGRLAYPNWIIKAFPEQFGASRAFFYDMNAKLSYKLNDRNRISLSAYRSYDNFKFPEDTLYSWKSNVASLQWHSVLAQNFLLNVSAIRSEYEFGIEGKKEGYQYWLTSSIRHQELKAGLLYTIGLRHKLEAGLSTIWYTIEPGNRQPVGESSSINPMALPGECAHEMAAYASEEFIISPNVTLQVGLRYSWFQNLGPRTVYSYETGAPRDSTTIIGQTDYAKGQVVQSYGGWEPRTSLRVGLGENNAVKLSYNRTRQYLHLISNTTAISPVDFWKLSDPFIPPQMADQVAIGFFHNDKNNTIESSIEAFYKGMTSLVEYKNGATLLMNPLLETSLLRAKGKAYGIELSFQKNKGKLTGQLSYTFSRSLVAVETPFPKERINDGEFYPSNYDKPHNIAISSQLAIGKGWTWGTNFAYSTGRPATYPDGLYVYNNTQVVNYSKRNADRIPDYHRLDFSFSKDTRRVKEQRRYSTWVFSLYNFYGRKNPYSVYFTRYNTTTVAYRLSVFGSVIPSVTWNFNF